MAPFAAIAEWTRGEYNELAGLNSGEERMANSECCQVCCRALAKSEERTAKSGEKVRFDVNGLSYLLSFNPNEGRWYLLTPGIGGRVKAIPVLDDAEGFVPNIVVPVGDEGQAVVN